LCTELHAHIARCMPTVGSDTCIRPAMPAFVRPRASHSRHSRSRRVSTLALLSTALAHLFADRAIRLAQPNDTLFLDTATYEWRAIDEFAVASYWIGRYNDSAKACEQLLANSAFPYEQLPRVTENLNFALQALNSKEPQTQSF